MRSGLGSADAAARWRVKSCGLHHPPLPAQQVGGQLELQRRQQGVAVAQDQTARAAVQAQAGARGGRGRWRSAARSQRHQPGLHLDQVERPGEAVVGAGARGSRPARPAARRRPPQPPASTRPAGPPSRPAQAAACRPGSGRGRQPRPGRRSPGPSRPPRPRGPSGEGRRRASDRRRGGHVEELHRAQYLGAVGQQSMTTRRPGPASASVSRNSCRRATAATMLRPRPEPGDRSSRRLR